MEVYPVLSYKYRTERVYEGQNQHSMCWDQTSQSQTQNSSHANGGALCVCSVLLTHQRAQCHEKVTISRDLLLTGSKANDCRVSSVIELISDQSPYHAWFFFLHLGDWCSMFRSLNCGLFLWHNAYKSNLLPCPILSPESSAPSRTQTTERPCMHGLLSHTGLYMPTVQQIPSFITSWAVSF